MLEPEGRAAPHRPGHDRGRAARLHARPHAQQLVHHPRRGAEHDARADEDVPHPPRLRLQGVVTGDVTQIDVPGGRSGLIGLEPCSAGSTASPSSTSPPRRRAPPDRARHRLRLRGGRTAGASAPVTIDVFVADEQQAHPIDVARWAELARQVLTTAGSRARPSLAALRRRGRHRQLNEQFLGKKGPTDVLSFPIEDEPAPTGARPTSAAPARGPARAGRADPARRRRHLPRGRPRNAAEHEVALDDELALLVVHGMLHLLGMDHEDDAEAERMEALEQQLLDRFYRAASGRDDVGVPPCWPRRASRPRTPSSSSSSLLLAPRGCWRWPRPAWCARARSRPSRSSTTSATGRATLAKLVENPATS